MENYKRSERRTLSYVQMFFRTLIGFGLASIQLIVYYVLLEKAKNVPGVSIGSFIATLIVVSYIYRSNKNPSYKLSWTIVCFLFNFIGPILYLIFGNGNNLPKRKDKKINQYLNTQLVTTSALDELKSEDEIGYKHAILLNHNTNGYPLYSHVPNTFYNDGLDLYNSMLDKIKLAKKYIFLEYFIIAEDTMFDELFPVLLTKAKEGVEVKIIYDAIGCGAVMRNKIVRRLNKYQNFQMVAYNPWGVNINLAVNYRDHRKITIVDGLYAFVGGINLADEYIHRSKRFGNWRDNGMMIEGKAIYSYTLLFAQNWYMSTKKMLVIEDYKAIHQTTTSNGYVMPFGDGPTNKKYAAYELFLSLINNAKKTVYLSTPYFIIDTQFVAAIVQAINSGIDVKLLIPSIPDKKMVYQVTLAHLKSILEAGGEVYEYSPGFNHAKNIIVDDKYAFVGTVNLDYRSMFLHFECGNFLINTDSITDMSYDFLDAVSKSKLLTLDEWKKRSIINKTIPFVVTILGPLL